MNVLIIGNGGREHALAWKIAQSKLIKMVFVAPGNAGTALEPNITNIPIAVDSIAELVTFAATHNVALTIVGPEAPLVLGIVDAFTKAQLHCLGPSQDAALLEGSKTFAKQFMQRHHIPTAAYATFTDLENALKYLRNISLPIVIKADGLAAGKGVVIARNLPEADAVVYAMLSEQRFGVAGSRIVIEEFLCGEEASFIALVDGTNVLPLATTQDHKAIGDGDTGPNTGGMGAYSPAPVLTPELSDTILRKVMVPTVQGMAEEGRPYQGFLYAGLMIGVDGTINVLEFNCRCGDPETQPLMLRLRSDLAELCMTAVAGNLTHTVADWDPQTALGVVLTAAGYPGNYTTGHIISGLSTTQAADTKIFHAGTKLQGDNVLTNGGRVLCVTALGATVVAAQQRAYAVADTINWPGRYCRRDIGYRAVRREKIITTYPTPALPLIGEGA